MSGPRIGRKPGFSQNTLLLWLVGIIVYPVGVSMTAALEGPWAVIGIGLVGGGLSCLALAALYDADRGRP
jgi:hypothetical protein